MDYSDCNYERGIELLQNELGMTEDDAEEETRKQWDGYISIPNPKELYDRLLHRCIVLEEPGDEDEADELERTMTHSIKAFLLFLVGLTLFTNKTNKNVNLIWLEGTHDLYMVHEWSWGRVTLDFVYT